jgi:hypothetical protein
MLTWHPINGEGDNSMLKRFAVLIVASGALALATPAIAGEVGVGVGPVGVTVGSGPDHVVHEREVIRERRPADEKVIIKKDHRPDVVEKKVIIRHDHD